MKHTDAKRARRAELAHKNASPKQRANRIRRQRMGVGLIERPLRFIASQTSKRSYLTRQATAAAQAGNGGAVRRIAFQVLAA